MSQHKEKQTCPHCRQASGVEIVYGSVDAFSEALRTALENGDVVAGGSHPRWDWEEELINARCLQCNHEWHRTDKNLRHKSKIMQAAAMPAEEVFI